MNASRIRGVVGLCGLLAAGVGIGLHSVALALAVCGLLLFALCVLGELRS